MLPRLALLLQTLIAAGTFLVAKDAAARFGSLPLTWCRIILSAVLMTAFFAIRTRRVPSLTGGQWRRLGLLGVLGVTANQGLFLYGIQYTTPLHAALLYAFTPVMVLTAAVLWFAERWTWARGVGVALAVAGVLGILHARGLDLSGGPFLGDLYILVAVGAWSAFTLLGKDVIRRLGVVTVITVAFLFGALSVLPAAPWFLSGFDPAAPGLQGWLDLLYLSGVTSGMSFTLWYYALKYLDASQAAVFTNLQTPVTALLAWFVFSEVPGVRTILGGLLVLLGVSLAQIPARPRIPD